MRESSRVRHAQGAKRPTNGELRRDAEERVAAEECWRIIADGEPPASTAKSYQYLDELVRLQFELLKMQ